MDDAEREAIRAEGLDPDDPAVRAAFDLVRWALELLKLRVPQPLGQPNYSAISQDRKLDIEFVADGGVHAAPRGRFAN
jgi:hypothetical protein